MTAPRQPDKTKATEATEQTPKEKEKKPLRSHKRHLTKERVLINKNPNLDRKLDALRQTLQMPETRFTDNRFEFSKEGVELKLEQIIKKVEELLKFPYEAAPKRFLEKMLKTSTAGLGILRSRRVTEYQKLQSMVVVQNWVESEHYFSKHEALDRLDRLSTVASHPPSVSVKKRMRTGTSKHQEEQKRVGMGFKQQLLKGVKGMLYAKPGSGMVFAAKDPSYYQAQELSETKNEFGMLAQFYQDIYKMKDIAFNGQVFLSDLTYAPAVFQRVNESDYFIHSAFPHDKWSRPGAPIREQLFLEN